MLIVERKAVNSFPYFVKHIFSESTEIFKDQTWCGGDYIQEICKWISENPTTIRVSARDHFKSMSFYAHIMWKLLKLKYNHTNREIQYFSYKESMSSYHLAKIKDAVACNPYFNGVIDKKAQAEGVIRYSWDNTKRLTVTPRGLMEFKRGIHSPDIYVDDPLQDPENKMILTKIKRINDIMKSQILDMFQNELHIAGTPQTTVDFFFDKNFTHRFSVKILPAIVNESTHEVLWQEWASWDELQSKIREKGQKIFNQEYMCSPVYVENAYIDKDKLYTVVNTELKNYTVIEWQKVLREREGKEIPDYDKVAGWDLGKKNHPSHFVIFEKRPTGEVDDGENPIYKRVQVHSKWFDGVDYIEQLDYITNAVSEFGVYSCYFDNTRGEMEMMMESGKMPAEFIPIHFTSKIKNSMAVQIDIHITNKMIEFLNDERQLSQMLLVNNELQALETPEGHADSFWSIGMSLLDIELEGANITII